VRLSRSFHRLGRRVFPSSHHGERRATGKSKSQRTCGRFRSASRIPATVYHREESVHRAVFGASVSRQCRSLPVSASTRTVNEARSNAPRPDERCARRSSTSTAPESLCSRWVSTRSDRYHPRPLRRASRSPRTPPLPRLPFSVRQRLSFLCRRFLSSTASPSMTFKIRSVIRFRRLRIRMSERRRRFPLDRLEYRFIISIHRLDH